MRRLIILASFLLVAATAYVVSPLVSAWLIREAVRTGDAAYLEHKIEWSSVKTTLKESLTRLAQKQPETAVDGVAVKPGLWQRFKGYWSRRIVEGMVESYATPTGLPQLFSYGKTYRDVVKGEADEAATLTLAERVRRFWARVKRAEFKTLTDFEVEVADKHDPDRHFVGLLRLNGVTWKLVELRVRQVSAIDTVAQNSTDH